METFRKSYFNLFILVNYYVEFSFKQENILCTEHENQKSIIH